MTAPLLKVSGLKKSYGAILAVDGVSFEVMPGEIFGVIGPNGSGKTTMFNSVLGQIKPNAGSIELNGKDITGLSPLELNRRGDDQVVAHAHLAEHLQGLERAPDAAPVQLERRQPGDVLAVELDAAGVRLDLAKHAVEHRRLARAVGPDHAEDLARHHLERHAVHGQDRAVGLLQPADFQQRRGHD